MKSPRINVTFNKSTFAFLTLIADKKNQSLSGLVKELAVKGLEDPEDFLLSKFAEKIEAKGNKKISYEDAWK